MVINAYVAVNCKCERCNGIVAVNIERLKYTPVKGRKADKHWTWEERTGASHYVLVPKKIVCAMCGGVMSPFEIEHKETSDD